MTNKLQIDDVATTALALLSYSSVLGETVFRDAEGDFYGGAGDSVRVRIPKRRTPTNFDPAKGTQYVDIDEGAVSVKLTDEPTDGALVTTHDLTLDIRDFGAQVLMPQMDGVARYVEKNIAALMNTQSAAEEAAEIDPSEPLKAITKAAAEFTRREIPPGERFLAVGPDVQNLLLDVEQLQKVSDAGEDSMLRRATMGDLFGFRVVVSPHLTGAVAYHKTAFALAVRAPVAHMSAGQSSSQTWNGYALRTTLDFSNDSKSDTSVVDTLCGSTVLDPVRMIPMKLKADEGVPQKTPARK